MNRMSPIFRHLGLFATLAMSAEDEQGSAQAEVAQEQAETKKVRAVFTPEQIAEIRALRAEVHPEGTEKAGKPVWSHLALAKRFGTTAGGISQIVRNRTYKNPDYVPVNDGN